MNGLTVCCTVMCATCMAVLLTLSWGDYFCFGSLEADGRMLPVQKSEVDVYQADFSYEISVKDLLSRFLFYFEV
jgi:hypothetical protein